jgi:hypothetical protein
MKRKNSTPIASDDFVEFRCPFCGQYVRATMSECTIVHVQPACDRFMASEPDDFLRAVNQEFFKATREKGIAAAREAFKVTPNVRKVEGEN